MAKKIKDISDNECYNLYDAIIKNSNKRWESAQLLADNKDYGGAIRDLITSIEEMVKAIIMLADSKGFEFRKIDGIESIIRRNHTIRHLIGFFMLGLNLFADDLKKLVIKFRSNPNHYVEMIKGENFMGDFVKKYLFEKILILQKEFYWFSRVEIIRQQGTHVDLEDDIISPLDISLEEYEEVFIRMKNVRYVGNEMIDTLINPGEIMIEELEKLKIQFIDEDWYSKIGKALHKTKQGKKNPFGLIEKGIKDLDFDIEDFMND